MQYQVITKSADETKKIGEKIGLTLVQGDVIALHGDLGSGKTTFTQGVTKTLGITQRIISPTFLILRTYHLPKRKYNLYHVDLYRTQNEADAQSIGLEEYINDKEDIIIIEWPEKIVSLLPKNTQHIYFEYVDEEQRKITYEKN